jgi:DNA-directed RNA polymerase specialized sigma24 family protein
MRTPSSGWLGNQESEDSRDDVLTDIPVAPVSLKPRRWSLSNDALGLLLEKLDRDPEVAAREYERIHERLTRFFEWRGCMPPEQLADEVLDRLAQKLEKGQSVQIPESKTVSYFLGIAHRVSKEVYRAYKLQGRQVEGVEDLPAPVDQAPADERLEQLDECLSRLTEADRGLLLGYYQGEKRVKIDNRNLMAERLGVSINGLRVRAHRLRQRVEKCMRTRLEHHV